MVLLVSTYSQNMMKNYSIWLKTERENICFHFIDFTKIAATVPLSIVLGGCMESYLHYKNATHKKTYFFNQHDQPLGQGLKPWSWGGGRHPPSPQSVGLFHHCSGISMLSKIYFLMFENGLTVQQLHTGGLFKFRKATA